VCGKYVNSTPVPFLIKATSLYTDKTTFHQTYATNTTMHTKDLFLASAAIGVATATATRGDVTTYWGTYANFFVQSIESNNNVVGALYEGCIESGSDKTIVSQGAVCVARLISCMLQAVATVTDDGTAVATINSTTNAFNETSGSKAALRRRMDSMPYMGHNVRVTDIMPSYVHPRDGVAFQTNVRTDDTTLNVHRDGSHLVARFDPSEIIPASKGDSFDTDGSPLFTFTNVNGIKMEAQDFSTGDDNRDLVADLTTFSYSFAYNGGSDSNFQTADVWEASLCGTTGGRKLALKIIPELDSFSTEYEQIMTPPGCNPDAN